MKFAEIAASDDDSDVEHMAAIAKVSAQDNFAGGIAERTKGRNRTVNIPEVITIDADEDDDLNEPLIPVSIAKSRKKSSKRILDDDEVDEDHHQASIKQSPVEGRAQKQKAAKGDKARAKKEQRRDVLHDEVAGDAHFSKDFMAATRDNITDDTIRAKGRNHSGTLLPIVMVDPTPGLPTPESMDTSQQHVPTKTKLSKKVRERGKVRTKDSPSSPSADKVDTSQQQDLPQQANTNTFEASRLEDDVDELGVMDHEVSARPSSSQKSIAIADKLVGSSTESIEHSAKPLRLKIVTQPGESDAAEVLASQKKAVTKEKRPAKKKAKSTKTVAGDPATTTETVLQRMDPSRLNESDRAMSASDHEDALVCAMQLETVTSIHKSLDTDGSLFHAIPDDSQEAFDKSKTSTTSVEATTKSGTDGLPEPPKLINHATNASTKPLAGPRYRVGLSRRTRVDSLHQNFVRKYP